MKLIILVACALVAVAVAAPPPPTPTPNLHLEHKEPELIVRSSFEQSPEGGYNYGYETAKGSIREETGELKEALDEDNKPHLVIVVRGQYSYTDPEGGLQSITYKADENGFEAVGDAIPKGPGADVPKRR